MSFQQDRTFDLDAGITIRLTASSSTITPTLRLYDPNNALLQEVVGTGSPSTAIIVHASYITGTYTAQVEGDAGDVQLQLQCSICSPPTDMTLDYTATYSTLCSGQTNPPLHFQSSNSVYAIDTFKLEDTFPMVEFWDGVCPILVGKSGRVDRNYPVAPIVIGPYAMDVVLFAGTNIYVDDVLTIDSTEVGILGKTLPKNTVLWQLPAGNTASIMVVERGGAWAFACGTIAVTDRPECIPTVMEVDATPEGWCAFGQAIGEPYNCDCSDTDGDLNTYTCLPGTDPASSNYRCSEICAAMYSGFVNIGDTVPVGKLNWEFCAQEVLSIMAERETTLGQRFSIVPTEHYACGVFGGAPFGSGYEITRIA